MCAAQSTTPPRYVIDLSCPPRDRYQVLAARYKAQLKALTRLFDQLLTDLALPQSWLPLVNRCSRMLLRRVSETEQTEELRGISDVTGVPMYLLVAFNVVLDLLMGCTSGAVRSSETRKSGSQAKMLHFRTLDWDMAPLRKIIVQLDFVRTASENPDQIIASSITYVGFLGVLTGVKPGMSLSLNFRAVHDASTRLANWRFYMHHVLVLLGRRPSIASLLRSSLLDGARSSSSHRPSIEIVAAELRERHTTAAYIVLSDGSTTLAMEKDYDTARIRRSSSFIAITNHDVVGTGETQEHTLAADASTGGPVRRSTGPEELFEESGDRLNCIESKWKAKVWRSNQNVKRSRSQTSRTEGIDNVSVTRREVINWLCDWPTTNEATHFAAILDPSAGEVSWCRSYPLPLQEPQCF